VGLQLVGEVLLISDGIHISWFFLCPSSILLFCSRTRDFDHVVKKCIAAGIIPCMTISLRIHVLDIFDYLQPSLQGLAVVLLWEHSYKQKNIKDWIPDFDEVRCLFC